MIAVAGGIILAVLFFAFMSEILFGIFKILEFSCMLFFGPFILAYLSVKYLIVCGGIYAATIGYSIYTEQYALIFYGYCIIAFFSLSYYYDNREELLDKEQRAKRKYSLKDISKLVKW